MKHKSQFDQLGVPLVAVGTGSNNFARKFQSGVPFEGNVFIDATAASFKAIDLPRLSLWEVTKRFLLNWTGLQFYKQISSQYQSSDMEGDGQQTGGIFVVGPGVGKPILYGFRENDNDVTAFADIDEILKACAA